MLGLVFVALLIAWLVVNAIKNPTDFFNVFLIGSFSLNKNGDLTGAKGAALLFTIYVGEGNHLKTLLTTSPQASLVDAARKAASG